MRPPGTDARRNGPRDAERSEAHQNVADNSSLDESRLASGAFSAPGPGELPFTAGRGASGELSVLIGQALEVLA